MFCKPLGEIFRLTCIGFLVFWRKKNVHNEVHYHAERWIGMLEGNSTAPNIGKECEPTDIPMYCGGTNYSGEGGIRTPDRVLPL